VHRPGCVRIRLRTSAAALALAAVLAGCGAVDQGAASLPTDQPGPRGTFLSTEVTEDGKPRVLAERTRVNLRFTDDGRLLATAGCNSLSGPVAVRGDRLVVSDLAMTDMGCDTARHDQDTWLAKVLRDGPSWRRDGENLVLTAGGTQIVLAPEKPVALEGTEWTVDGRIDGRTASSLPGTATVVFDGGRVVVRTGCGERTSSYTRSGDTLRLDGPVRLDGVCAEPQDEPNRSITSVLTGEVTHRIDSRTLTLTNASGVGLTFRAP
jgi:heat shock protein HslJ